MEKDTGGPARSGSEGSDTLRPSTSEGTETTRVPSNEVAAVGAFAALPFPLSPRPRCPCDCDERDPELPSAIDIQTLPPLKLSTTAVSTRSAREALHTLETFERSPHNPRNWNRGRKWRTTLTVAATGFISTCGSSIAVPGIHSAMEDFGYTNSKVGVLITSCYVLGMGVGPFVFAPLSELYGRQIAYQSAQSLFIAFCLGSARAPTMTGLIFLRFFCGVFASVGPSLGVATIADMFRPHERGKPVSIYALGPMTGPVLGSMLGYWIVYGGWRWLHWTISIMAGANWVLLVSLTQETFAPVILKKLQYRLEHQQEDPTSFLDRLSPRRIIHDLGWMKEMVSRKELVVVFGRAFSRPPRLMFGNPVALIFSIYYAYLYGIIYVFLVSAPLLFGAPPFVVPSLFHYNWPQYTLGFSYTGLAIGFFLAAATAAICSDRIYQYLSRKHGNDGEPEYRIIICQLGMFIMPAGLFMYGWTAHAEVHWMAPMVAMALVSYGLMVAFSSIQNFLVDAFFPYSAAAIAGATALRSVIGCILPIFSGDMYRHLGWGWGNTLLGCITLLAFPLPWIMFTYGKSLRVRYKFNG